MVRVADTAALTDDGWSRVEPLLPPLQSGHRTYAEHRPILRHTGAPWRAIPAHFGPWHTSYSRYQRWHDDGAWQRLLDALTPTTSRDESSTQVSL